jgi:type II secretory pathway pseudopilin PulG
MYTCRECEQAINQATEVCPYCGADLTETGLDIADEQPSKSPLKKVVILWGVVFVSIVGIAWFAFPWRLAGSRPEAEAHAMAAVAKIQAALATYNGTEQTYPSSLEVLGAASRDASQEAESGRYNVQYAAGSPDSDGRIRSYTLIARAGNYGYLNVFSDETGIIRGTRENRAATGQDPPVKRNAASKP